MRNIRKWLVLALSVVMLVGSFGFTAAAAENGSPVGLYVSPAVTPDSPIAVQVTASEGQTVADGKLVVTYDAELLTYVGTELGAAWADPSAVTLSVNPKDGKVILAFASAAYAAEGTVFTLTFQAKASANSTVSLDGSSYVTGAGDISGSALVCVSAQCISVKLNAGTHGAFADGTTETVITTLSGAALSDGMLPPVVADRGYALSGWMTDDGTVYAPGTLDLVPTDGMTLTAQYTFVCDGGPGCPSSQFVDMTGLFPEAHAAIDYMVERCYMNGMSSTIFGPHVDLNRAMMVTILYRIAGSPAVEGSPAFTDVPEGVFYTAPVVWATENGITTGLTQSLFAPDKSLTRQELVTFLYRFAGYMGYDVTASTDLSTYTDASKVQPYATDAFQWAVATGVIKGTTETTLEPEATTTRAQVSLMVFRLLSVQD